MSEGVLAFILVYIGNRPTHLARPSLKPFSSAFACPAREVQLDEAAYSGSLGSAIRY